MGDISVHRTIAPQPHRLLAHLGKRKRHEQHTAIASVEFRADRFKAWHPAALLVPDGKLPWVPFALSWALAQDAEDRCDVVLSTQPPATALLLGALIASAWRVPHVVDYRDPWNGKFDQPSRIWPLTLLELALERQILSSAAAAIMVRETHEFVPQVEIPLHVIPNGYDEDDFQLARALRPEGDWVIASVGTLWKGRGIEPLAAALTLLKDRRPDLSGHIHFLHIGRIDHFVAQELRGLSQIVSVSAPGQMSHPDAIGYMLGADLLYLPTVQDYIPGKAYEYIRSGTPVLGVGSLASTLASLLEQTGTGRVYQEADAQGIAGHIEAIMTHAGQTSPREDAVIARYSRQATAQQLAAVLNDVVDDSGQRSLFSPACTDVTG
jgi:glycosyltransferase involved in cell wall biosynthesis